MCRTLQLKPGEIMSAQDAVLQAIGGRAYYARFARTDSVNEKGEWLWKDKIVEIIPVQIYGFGERNNKHEPKLSKRDWKASEKQFERDDKIVVIIVENDLVHEDKGLCARILTRPATEDIGEFSDREPVLWNRDKKILKDLFGEIPKVA